MKQCTSLAQRFNVTLVVADGLGDSNVNNVNIIDIGKPNGRLNRMFEITKLIYKKAVELDADLYHLHDPELLPVALKLKRKGKKVIFDAHEDFPKQVLTKPYLNKYFAKIVSFSMSYYEKYICSKLDLIVTATPTIGKKFSSFCKNVIDINNYPLLGELQPLEKNWMTIRNEIAYVGGISKIRGIQESIDALALLKTNTQLNLVGKFSEITTYENVKKSKGWNSVNELGQLNREQVRDVLQRSVAGLVTFLPVPNHIDAQPNKMFEYMSAGIPVIGSNYPLWRSIIEDNGCGICVNPEKPEEIAVAIDKLITDRALAENMGKNGIRAVNEKYNWSIEEKKLFKLYTELLGS
ncbi:glycosyltransferase family 4 protein [Acinetobacter baumannii]|nr:glycosyltransferase family 4 protein [Acinetobacter baumannii]MDH2614867.1 glycosyltransferase family 4 protein [Acinetobacter baumannii]MDH2618374.1 glycosyltransferase family 4 protein [Acinetobacter baumannii]